MRTARPDDILYVPSGGSRPLPVKKGAGRALPGPAGEEGYTLGGADVSPYAAACCCNA